MRFFMGVGADVGGIADDEDHAADSTSFACHHFPAELLFFRMHRMRTGLAGEGGFGGSGDPLIECIFDA